MALTNKIKEKISIEVIKTLVTRFDNFPEDALNNRNAPFHEAFLNAFSDKLKGKVSDTPFFISLSSWLHGLNTTLGLTFFENVAQHLSQGEKREYTSKRLGNLLITQSHRDNIAQILADLSTSTKIPDLEYENKKIFSNFNAPLINANDFSTDVFIEDANTITAIELKSVKPNSGEMKGEKLKILEGKAALFREFPDKKIEFYIGFPFDPTINPETESITSHNKKRFLDSIINMRKYFASNETLIANELWDLLSQQNNTMEQILDVINSISTTEFMTKYQYLNNNKNRNHNEYLDILNEWNLYSEVELIKNNDIIRKKITEDKFFTRVYNKHAFDAKGNYDHDRYLQLKKLIG